MMSSTRATLLLGASNTHVLKTDSTTKHPTSETVGRPSGQFCSPTFGPDKAQLLTIGVDGLSVRRSYAEDDSNQDVLEGGDQEQCRVLVIERLQFLIIYVRLGVPRLTTDPEEDEDLDREVDDGLTDDAGQDLLGNEARCRPLRVNLRVWQCPAHCKFQSISSHELLYPLIGYALATAIGMMMNKSM